jgi:hypothetical protein
VRAVDAAGARTPTRSIRRPRARDPAPRARADARAEKTARGHTHGLDSYSGPPPLDTCARGAHGLTAPVSRPVAGCRDPSRRAAGPFRPPPDRSGRARKESRRDPAHADTHAEKSARGHTQARDRRPDSRCCRDPSTPAGAPRGVAAGRPDPHPVVPGDPLKGLHARHARGRFRSRMRANRRLCAEPHRVDSRPRPTRLSGRRATLAPLDGAHLNRLLEALEGQET